MINESLLPPEMEIQAEKLAKFIASFFLPEITSRARNLKTASDERVVKYTEYYKLATQYRTEGLPLFKVIKTDIYTKSWGKATMIISSRNNVLPPVIVKLSDGFDQSFAGMVSKPPESLVYILADRQHFINVFKKSTSELVMTVIHEIKHYYQFTNYHFPNYPFDRTKDNRGLPKNTVGLPKYKVRDKKTNLFGTFDYHGEKRRTVHHMRDIEFKPNVHTYGHYIKNFLNQKVARSGWWTVFKDIMIGNPVSDDDNIKFFIKSLLDMRLKDVNKWKQFVKELYKEIFSL